MNAPMFKGLLAPYGGMTPYRQRQSAFIRRLSRAVKGSGLLQAIARPVDGFKGVITRQSACEARQRVGSVMDGYLLLDNLAYSPISRLLRFLIISEVSATGCLICRPLNRPVSLTLTGFGGF